MISNLKQVKNWKWIQPLAGFLILQLMQSPVSFALTSVASQQDAKAVTKAYAPAPAPAANKISSHDLQISSATARVHVTIAELKLPKGVSSASLMFTLYKIDAKGNKTQVSQPPALKLSAGKNLGGDFQVSVGESGNYVYKLELRTPSSLLASAESKSFSLKIPERRIMLDKPEVKVLDGSGMSSGTTPSGKQIAILGKLNAQSSDLIPTQDKVTIRILGLPEELGSGQQRGFAPVRSYTDVVITGSTRSYKGVLDIVKLKMQAGMKYEAYIFAQSADGREMGRSSTFVISVPGADNTNPGGNNNAGNGNPSGGNGGGQNPSGPGIPPSNGNGNGQGGGQQSGGGMTPGGGNGLPAGGNHGQASGNPEGNPWNNQGLPPGPPQQGGNGGVSPAGFWNPCTSQPNSQACADYNRLNQQQQQKPGGGTLNW